ncbi:MAG: hypothetical protein ACE5DX_00805 [Candidatus Dojkabacteria bacterium]
MHDYLTWDKTTLDSYEPETITEQYSQGYVFGRTGKGDMFQTRSLRVELSRFQLSSENRRVTQKFPELKVKSNSLPLTEDEYDWNIHRLGKEFYTKKFGVGTFSASKLRAILKDDDSTSFNMLLEYSLESTVGYAICYQNNSIIHYAYPFYEFELYPANLGMSMMIGAIEFAAEMKLEYIYLGSVKNESDKYKLQFSGLQWFDGKDWQGDLSVLKKLLVKS